MTLAEKHGFRFVPTEWEARGVQAYFMRNVVEHGYPLDMQSDALGWTAVVGDDERVYAVFGWKPIPGGVVDITDFYSYPNRKGVLAAYAAIEYIKGEADRTGVPLVTATPEGNTTMIAAYKRIFSVDRPTLLVFKYVPEHVPVAAAEAS